MLKLFLLQQLWRFKMANGGRERWRAVIVQQGESGLSVAEFCRRRRVAPASFYLWRKRFQREREEVAQNGAASCASEPSDFVRLAATPAAAIEVEFRCGAVLRLPTGDLPALNETLAQTIAALASAGGGRE